MSLFNNQVVVITGGSDGIGKALVEQFLAMGARVATCGRSQEKLHQLQVQHPGADDIYGAAHQWQTLPGRLDECGWWLLPQEVNRRS